MKLINAIFLLAQLGFVAGAGFLACGAVTHGDDSALLCAFAFLAVAVFILPWLKSLIK